MPMRIGPTRSVRVKNMRTESGRDVRPGLDARPRSAVVVASCGPLDILNRTIPALQLACAKVGIRIVIVRRDDKVGIAALRGVYPEVRIVAAPANVSESALRSVGMREARADIVYFIDDATLGDSSAIANRLQRLGTATDGGVSAGPLSSRLDERAVVLSAELVGNLSSSGFLGDG